LHPYCPLNGSIRIIYLFGHALHSPAAGAIGFHEYISFSKETRPVVRIMRSNEDFTSVQFASHSVNIVGCICPIVCPCQLRCCAAALPPARAIIGSCVQLTSRLYATTGSWQGNNQIPCYPCDGVESECQQGAIVVVFCASKIDFYSCCNTPHLVLFSSRLRGIP